MSKKKYIVIIEEEPVTEENIKGLDVTKELSDMGAMQVKAFCTNQKECGICPYRDGFRGCIVSGPPENWPINR